MMLMQGALEWVRAQMWRRARALGLGLMLVLGQDWQAFRLL